VKSYMCVKVGRDWYHLNRAAMGQRQTVFVAEVALRVLSNQCVCSHLTYIDGLLSVGPFAALRADLVSVKERSTKANYTWNENLDDPDSLIKEEVEFLGLVLNLRNKSVKLTKKVLRKLATSWDQRKQWNVRSLIVHISLLLYGFLATNRDPARWQRVLQLWARFQGLVSEDKAHFRNSFQLDMPMWTLIEEWTRVMLDNEWVPVPNSKAERADFLIISDASGYGWAGIVISLKSGQATLYRGRWPPPLVKDAKHSSFAEPLGLVATVNSFFVKGVNASAIYLGDNKGFIHTVNKGYTTTYRQVAMEFLAQKFPGLKLAAAHVEGAIIPMDRPSRGLPLDEDAFRDFCKERGIDVSVIRELTVTSNV